MNQRPCLPQALPNNILYLETPVAGYPRAVYKLLVMPAGPRVAVRTFLPYDNDQVPVCLFMGLVGVQLRTVLLECLLGILLHLCNSMHGNARL